MQYIQPMDKSEIVRIKKVVGDRHRLWTFVCVEWTVGANRIINSQHMNAGFGLEMYP